MVSNTDYTKLIKLIEVAKFEDALKEIQLFKKTDDFSLKIVQLFCQMKIKKKRTTNSLLKKMLEEQPDNELLLEVETYLTDEKNKPNPLIDFINSFVAFHKSEISNFNQEQLDKMLYQLIVKPTIK